MSYDFARYVRDQRQANGVSRQQLADAIGYSPSAIKQVELGQHPSVDLAGALLSHFDAPVLYRAQLIGQLFPGLLSGPPAPALSELDAGRLQRLCDTATTDRLMVALEMPAFRVVAASSSYRRMFQGLGIGDSVLVWDLVHPAARRVIVDWESRAMRDRWFLRAMSLDALTSGERQLLPASDPTGPPPRHEQMLPPTLLLRDPVTGEIAIWEQTAMEQRRIDSHRIWIWTAVRQPAASDIATAS